MSGSFVANPNKILSRVASIFRHIVGLQLSTDTG